MLYHGIRARKGFVVLTGEVGTGKTLMIRYLLRVLGETSDVTYAYVFNSHLSPLEFLQYSASDMGLPSFGKTKSEVLSQLGKFLIDRGSKQLTTALIVDEAHHLSVEVLEEIRLLTNLETSQDKLLQVLLVGQPELDDKLDSPSLRQLKQRIAHRCRLDPLDSNQTWGYIKRRLELAGYIPNGQPLFPSDTVSCIYEQSQGIPRVINAVCENALITGYVRQAHCITPKIIDDVSRDLRLHVRTMPFPVDRELDIADDTEILRTAGRLLELYARRRTPATVESFPIPSMSEPRLK